MSDEPIDRTQAEELRRLRTLLGEPTFQRIQLEVWKKFSAKTPPINDEGDLAPLALFSVWDELVHALREMAKRRAHERESASRNKPVSGQLWELNKGGVTWAAMIRFRGERQGWEVVMIRNGLRTKVQLFGTREKAEAWADKECIEVAMGWRV